MEDGKPQMTRDGTMQVTAKEGISYLQGQEGGDVLLKLQGLGPSTANAEPSSTAQTGSIQNGGPTELTKQDTLPISKLIEREASPAIEEPFMSFTHPEEPPQAAVTTAPCLDSPVEYPAAPLLQEVDASPVKVSPVKVASPEADTSTPLPSETQVTETKPNIPKYSTMVNTAQEAETLLSAQGKPDVDACTRGQQKKIEEITTKPQKPAIPRDNTMVNTAKEAEKILEAQGKPDEDALTRAQQKKIEEIKSDSKADDEPPAKKTKLQRDTTMQATAKESKDILGKEKLEDSRQATKAKRERKTGPKKSTADKVMEEAKELLGKGVDVTSGRQTRSGGRRPPPPSPPKKATGGARRGRKPKESAAEKQE